MSEEIATRDERARQESMQKAAMDARFKTTVIIWACAAWMMTVSTALAARTENTFVPFMVMMVTGLSTLGVWFGGRERSHAQAPSRQPIDNSQRTLQELEERLANMEAITRFEQLRAEERLPEAVSRRVASQPSGSVNK